MKNLKIFLTFSKTSALCFFAGKNVGRTALEVPALSERCRLVLERKQSNHKDRRDALTSCYDSELGRKKKAQLSH